MRALIVTATLALGGCGLLSDDFVVCRYAAGDVVDVEILRTDEERLTSPARIHRVRPEKFLFKPMECRYFILFDSARIIPDTAWISDRRIKGLHNPFLKNDGTNHRFIPQSKRNTLT